MKLSPVTHPDYEQFTEPTLEPKDAPRHILVTPLQKYCDGLFIIYECLSPKWKVLLRVLTLKCDLDVLRKSITLQHQQKQLDIAIVHGAGDRLKCIQTMAIIKTASIQKVGVPINYSLFRLDMVFFGTDSYIYFHERTMPITSFMAYVPKLGFGLPRNHPHFFTHDKLHQALRESLNRLHLLKIVHMTFNEEAASYSISLQRPVLSGLATATCLYENFTERTTLLKTPPTGKYEINDYLNCRAILDSKEMKLRFNQYEVNLFQNDQFALKQTIKALYDLRSKASQVSKDAQLIESVFFKENINTMELSKIPLPIFEAIMLSIAFVREFQEFSVLARRNRRNDDFIVHMHQTLAELYKEQKRYNDLYELYKYLVDEKKDDVLLKCKFAEACILTDKLRQAEAIIHILPRKYALTSLLEAKLLFARGSFGKSEEVLKTLNSKLERARKSGYQIYSLFLLNEIYCKTNDNKKALECLRSCEKLLKSSPDLVSKQLEVAVAQNLANLEAEESADASAKQYQKLIDERSTATGKQSPAILNLHYNLLVAYITVGDLRQAEKLYATCYRLSLKQSQSCKEASELKEKIKLIRIHLDVLLRALSIPEDRIQRSPSEAADVLLNELYLNGSLILNVNRKQSNYRGSTAVSIVELRKRMALRLLCFKNLAEAEEEIGKAVSYFKHNVKRAPRLNLTLDITRLFVLMRNNDNDKVASGRLIEQLTATVDSQYFTDNLKVLFFYLCGVKWFRSGSYRQSLECLQRASSIYTALIPHEDTNNHLLATIDSLTLKLYERLSMHQRIRELYRIAIEKGTQRPDMYKFLGDLSYQEQDYGKAIEEYKMFTKNLRKQKGARNMQIIETESLIADCYRKKGNRDAALEYYLKVESLNQHDTIKQIADIYYERKQYPLAFTYYSRLDYEHYPQIAKMLATLCTRLEQHKHKTNLYLKVYMNQLDRDRKKPQSDPDVYQIMSHLTNLSVEQRIICLTKYLSMSELLAKISKKPRQEVINAPAYQLLADLYHQKGDKAKALTIYAKLAQSNKQLAESLVGKIFSCSAHSDRNSVELFKTTLRGYEAKYGQLHANTIQVVVLLADRMFREEKYFQAYIYGVHTLELEKYRQDESFVDRIFVCLEKLTSVVASDRASFVERAKQIGTNWSLALMNKLNRILQLADQALSPNKQRALEFIQQLIFECLLIHPKPRPFLNQFIAMASGLPNPTTPAST